MEMKMLEVRFHERLNKAILKWVKLTGVDPKETSFTIGGREISSYEIRNTYREFNEAQELDPSGLTAAMLLRAFVDWYTENVAFTAKELIEKPIESDAKIQEMRDLIAAVDSPEILGPTSSFMQWVRTASEHYKIKDKEGLDNLLEDRFDMAFLRRDAIKAIEKLRAYQFSFGRQSDKPMKFYEKILQFWSVNSLLRGMMYLPASCVILSLIRDAEAQFSYFVIAIRNGANLTVLTDKQKWTHPEQKHMTRRKDRIFEERAFQYWFPYQLLKYELKNKDVKIPKQEGLVRYNQEAVNLADVRDMGPHQIVWMMILLGLIEEKYHKEFKALPSKAFTGEMVVDKDALERHTTALAVTDRRKLEVPRYTASMVTTDRMIEEKQWERAPTRHHEWMEKRYESKIEGKKLLFVGDASLPKLPVISAGEERIRPSWEKEPHVKLKAVDPTEFGTQEEIVRDAQWGARYNKAKLIEQEAIREFKEKREEVVEWWRERVMARTEILASAMMVGEFKGSTHQHSREPGWGRCFEVDEFECNILQLKYRPEGLLDCDDGWWRKRERDGRVVIGEFFEQEIKRGWRRSRYIRHFLCCKRFVKACVYGYFTVNTARSIAAVAGCLLEELPIFLQNYRQLDPYGGNSILDRLDPMDWAIKDPWRELKLGVSIWMCKRAFNERRQEKGLSAFKEEDWNKIGLPKRDK